MKDNNALSWTMSFVAIFLLGLYMTESLRGENGKFRINKCKI